MSKGSLTENLPGMPASPGAEAQNIKIDNAANDGPPKKQLDEEEATSKRSWREKRASIHAEMPSSVIHKSGQGTSLARKAMTKERAKKLSSGAPTDPSRRPKTAGAMEMRLMQEVNKRGLKADMDDDGDIDEIDRLKQIDIVREMPVPLKWKREMRDKLYDMMPDFEGSGCSAWIYKRKVKAYISKRKGKKQWNEFSQYFVLWSSAMTKVEGNHGSGVLTYFTFLRWLFLVNIIIFLATFMFVVIPQVAFPAQASDNSYSQWVIANTSSSVIATVDTCSANYVHNITISTAALDLVLNFIQGTGWMENTVMFQGYYVNKLVSISATYGYNIPLAYLCTMMFYFFFSLILIVFKTSAGFRERLFITASASRQFCNLVFAAWDYNVSKEGTANLRFKSFYRNIEGELAEYERQLKLKNRTTKDKCKIYTIRILVNLLVFATLGGGGYLIYFTTVKTVEITGSTYYDSLSSIVRTLVQFMTSLTITALNAILPPIYKILVRFEDYSPSTAVSFTLFRTVFLKLASLAILLISILSEITCATKDDCRIGTGSCSSVSCWETKIGQEIYKLVITDFFLLIGMTFVVEFPRWLIVTKCSCKLSSKIGQQQFDVAKEVLTLIYEQTLLWLGAFYSPIIPAIVVLKNFIRFYVKYLATMVFYGPSTKPHSSSDSDAFFMYVLLCAYTLCVVPVGYCVWMIPPSRSCGPFRLYDKIYDIVNITIATWPSSANSFFTFLQSTIFELTAITVLVVCIVYLGQIISAYKSMMAVLREQLVMENYDKKFLLEKIHELSGDGPPKKALYKKDQRSQIDVKPSTPTNMVAPGVPIV